MVKPPDGRQTRRRVAFLGFAMIAATAAPVDSASSAIHRIAAVAPASWLLLLEVPQLKEYVDTSRVERISEDVRRVAVRFVYSDPQHLPGEPTVLYTSLEMAIDLNCHGQMARDYTPQRFDAVGTALDSVSGTVPMTDWHPFHNAVLGSASYAAVCVWLAGVHHVFRLPGSR
jgi:hypothetical protein